MRHSQPPCIESAECPVCARFCCKTLSDHSDGRMIRSAAPLGKNDSWSRCRATTSGSAPPSSWPAGSIFCSARPTSACPAASPGACTGGGRSGTHKREVSQRRGADVGSSATGRKFARFGTSGRCQEATFRFSNTGANFPLRGASLGTAKRHVAMPVAGAAHTICLALRTMLCSVV